jgi:hypothetical protein
VEALACTDARSDYAVLELFCFFFLSMPVMQGMKKKERQELSVREDIYNNYHLTAPITYIYSMLNIIS